MQVQSNYYAPQFQAQPQAAKKPQVQFGFEPLTCCVAAPAVACCGPTCGIPALIVGGYGLYRAVKWAFKSIGGLFSGAGDKMKSFSWENIKTKFNNFIGKGDEAVEEVAKAADVAPTPPETKAAN